MIYSRVKLLTEIFTKNGGEGLQTMEFRNVDYWNIKEVIGIPQIPYFPPMQKNV